MANSKSTIYPIQLQGAELCLNRYDAEIKQYSGFNKNNSPFVGGCLSNVFTKEEQIEGGNDDNVYIDENGDVYEVDTAGLKKNDEYVINFPENTVFWEREKIAVNEEVLKVLCSNLFIVKHQIDGVDCFCFKAINENENGEIVISYEKIIELTRTDEEKFLTDPAYFNYIFINKDGYEIIIYTYADLYDHKMWISWGDRRPLRGYQRYNDIWLFIGHPEAAYLVTHTSSRSCLCFDEDTGQVVWFTYTPLGAVDVRGYTVNINSSIAHPPVISVLTLIATTTTDRIPIVPPDAPDLHYQRFDNKISLLKGNNYPSNTFVLDVQVNGYQGGGEAPSTFQVLPFYCTFKNPYFAENGGNYSFQFREYCTLGFPTSSQNLANWRNNLQGYKENSKKEGLVTRYFSVYDWECSIQVNVNGADQYIIVHLTNDWPGSMNGFTFEKSYISEATYFVIGKWAIGDYIPFGKKFHIACNNNNLSAICGKYVLLTNWNSITDVEAISFHFTADGKEEIFYKEGSEYFKLTQSTPKLSKKLNQIVCNADYIKNSYDIERKKALFYAPAYNSFRMFALSSSSMKSVSSILISRNQDYSNNVSVAAAINEYNLEDNSSIILNPIAFYKDADATFELHGCLPDVNTDIYTSLDKFGKPQAIIDYKYTAIWKEPLTNNYNNLFKNVNVKLKGLPFPSDTNGNVTYSPSLFGKVVSQYGNNAFYLDNDKGYPLNVGNNNKNVFNFFLGSEIEGFENAFIIQGQYYGIINNSIFSMQYNNGVVSGVAFVVSVEGLQFVGNTPYETLFFSKTNRCLYSFTGANVLNQKQLVDKISEVKNYLYNPATQTVFLITDIGVLFYGLFGMFLLEYTDITNIFLLDNGIVMSDNNGNYRYIKYYLDEGDEGYTKQNINVETSFYGMNNETVTINDCLYFRIFSEKHEEGDLKVSATTISLSGRKTEETTFKIKASDWDKITHTIYLRYQPKTQRGLGVAFAIDSPFKIASLSVGSQPDAVLVDKVSKGAINAPSVTTNNNEW